jgi:hypothetical protein
MTLHYPTVASPQPAVRNHNKHNHDWVHAVRVSCAIILMKYSRTALLGRLQIPDREEKVVMGKPELLIRPADVAETVR